MLPKEVGNTAAVWMLGAGVLGLALGERLPRPSPKLERWLSILLIATWTVVLFASIYPLVLGPFAFHPRGLFEVNVLAVGAIVRLAWRHRFDPSALRALRYGFLGCVLVAALWQAGVPRPSFDLLWLGKMLVVLPPLIVALALARTTPCPG